MKTRSAIRCSPRKMQALFRAAQGLDTQAIAKEMKLSDSTVKNMFTRIYNILGVNNRTEAVVAALRNGHFTIADLDKKMSEVFPRGHEEVHA